MQNGDKITVDLVHIFYWYVKNHKPKAEYYEDVDGNIELYIPESKEYTEFRIKIPKDNKKYYLTLDKQTK